MGTEKKCIFQGESRSRFLDEQGRCTFRANPKSRYGRWCLHHDPGHMQRRYKRSMLTRRARLEANPIITARVSAVSEEPHAYCLTCDLRQTVDPDGWAKDHAIETGHDVAVSRRILRLYRRHENRGEAYGPRPQTKPPKPESSGGP